MEEASLVKSAAGGGNEASVLVLSLVLTQEKERQPEADEPMAQKRRLDSTQSVAAQNE